MASDQAQSGKAPFATFARVLRKRRLENGLSINELARLASISKSNLARLEAGDGNPSLETLWALSAALGINVSELMERASPGSRLVRAGSRLDVFAENTGFAVKLLSTCPAGAMRDLYLATWQPEGQKVSEPHPAGTIEHIILLAGRARVGPMDAAADLAVGDYFSFCADQRHCYEALETDTTAIIIMESR